MRAVRSCVCNSRAAVLWTVVFCSLAALTGSVAASENSKTSMADPLIAVHDGFVDEKTCSSCHADQAAAFAKSHHAKAMTVADDKSVLGDFNNIQFDRDGVAASFFRRDDRFFVRTEGPDGKQADYQVKYTFAYEPLQQYLVDLGGGRLQALDIAWDTQKREWFWLGEGSAAKPGSTFHWTGPFYRWNRTCIDCHSTDPRTNFEPQSNEYNSSYVATSIGCQSCHGGGAKHVEWARAKAANASTAAADPGLAKVDSNTCFACHARRTRLVDRYQPGDTFSISFPLHCFAATSIFRTGRSWTRFSNTVPSSKARWRWQASPVSTATGRTRVPSRPRAMDYARSATPRLPRNVLQATIRAARSTPRHTRIIPKAHLALFAPIVTCRNGPT